MDVFTVALNFLVLVLVWFLLNKGKTSHPALTESWHQHPRQCQKGRQAVLTSKRNRRPRVP